MNKEYLDLDFCHGDYTTENTVNFGIDWPEAGFVGHVFADLDSALNFVRKDFYQVYCDYEPEEKEDRLSFQDWVTREQDKGEEDSLAEVSIIDVDDWVDEGENKTISRGCMEKMIGNYCKHLEGKLSKYYKENMDKSCQFLIKMHRIPEDAIPLYKELYEIWGSYLFYYTKDKMSKSQIEELKIDLDEKLIISCRDNVFYSKFKETFPVNTWMDWLFDIEDTIEKMDEKKWVQILDLYEGNRIIMKGREWDEAPEIIKTSFMKMKERNQKGANNE